MDKSRAGKMWYTCLVNRIKILFNIFFLKKISFKYKILLDSFTRKIISQPC